MNYVGALIAFGVAGIGLLGWLVLSDVVSVQRSTREMRLVKRDIRALKDAGKEISEARGEEIAQAMRRAIRRMVIDPKGEAEREAELGVDLPGHEAAVKLLRDTFVPEGLEERRFPVRGYAEADPATKDSMRQVLIVLRSLREAVKAGVHDRK
jgi:hypothetical protein